MKTSAAVKHFGSKSKLAAALGVARSAVSNWGDVVPARRAYEIEKLSDGALKAPALGQRKRKNQQSASAS